MLEADIAEAEVIRVSERLNEKREKLGRTKLRNYHVVVLSRRRHVSKLPEGFDHTDRKSPRLHFRRGHWRHYANYRTWILWQLVGDPDLGFVDKHYRL
jgi:hypothetical protein